MARWEALRRRAAAGRPIDDGPTSPLRELAEAARKVVDQHPEMSITVTVQAVDGTSSVRVAWADGELTVTTPDTGTGDTGTADTGTATAGDGPHDPERVSGAAAARLAELLRRDPSLLSDRPGPDS